MRIQTITLPQEHEGLKPATLKGLGQIVYVAGPNGAGKTRFLNFVKWAGSDPTTSKKHFVVDVGDKKPNVVDLSFQTRVLNDPNGQIQAHIRDAYHSIRRSVSTTEAATKGLLAITEEFNRYFAMTHPERSGDSTPEDVAQCKHSLDSLLSLIKAFTGLAIKPNKTGNDPYVDGRPLADARLSDGQRTLLIAAILLHYQGGNLDDFVLTFDEPENHLHPAAANDMIARFRTACPQGQIFIATHSVHLLAAADPDEIWFVKQGELQKAGRDPQEILWSLLGDEPGREQLAAFIARPDEYARTLFAGQCLLPPGVVDTLPGDPQTLQIANALSVVKAGHAGPLRVLDYGAGHARLLVELVEHAKKLEPPRPVHEVWDYFAFNDQQYTDSKVEAHCQQQLLQHYPQHVPPTRYFAVTAKLSAELATVPVQVVVMCNVLHEVAPGQWPALFAQLSAIMVATGYLLIVEDHCLRDGECAHQFGFLVLDAPQLNKLFDMQASDEPILTYAHPSPRYADRLKAHRVPAKVLSRVSATTRAAALGQLVHDPHAAADALRTAQGNIGNARRYAYWTQQHFNAVCAAKAFPT